MSNKSDVFNLVERMTSVERRYFKVFTQAFKKNSDHVRLFDFISNQKSKNENLLEKFEIGFNGNKAALKRRYLKTQILTSLRNYYKDQTPGLIIMNLLQDVEILYHKKLFIQCEKTLKRAKKVAIKHERFGLYLEILNWERRLISSTLENYTLNEKDIALEEKKTHEKYNNVVWAKQLHSTVFEFKKEHGFLITKGSDSLRELIPIKEFNSLNMLVSERASFYYYWASSIYYWILSDFEKSYQFTSKLTLEYKNVIDPEDFFYGILEHLTACICTHRYEELLNNINIIEELVENEAFGDYSAVKDRFFYYKANYSSIAYTVLGKRIELINTLNIITDRINEKDNPLVPQIEQVLKSTIGHAWFALGNFTRAKKLYWEILNTPKSQIRNDVYDNAKLYYPFILFEMEEYELMEYEAKSSHIHFLQNEERYSYVLIILRELLKLKSYDSKKEKKEFAKVVLEQIEKKLVDKETPSHFEDFLLKFWAKSIINNSSCLSEAQKGITIEN